MSKILLLDQPRTSQPQIVVPVADKYANKLLGVYNPAIRPPDWPLTGTYSSYVTTRRGFALEITGGTTYAKKTVSAHQNTGFSILYSGFIPAMDGTSRDVAGTYNSTSYQSLVYVTPTGLNVFYKNGTSVTFPCKQHSDGMPFTVAFTGNGSRYYGRLWLDGEITQVSGTYTGTSAYDSLHCGNRFSAKKARGTLAAFWNRALSDAECIDLVGDGDPWQIFAPEQIPVFIPDAASGAPTLSALTASLITSYGCRATVQVAR